MGGHSSSRNKGIRKYEICGMPTEIYKSENEIES